MRVDVSLNEEDYIAFVKFYFSTLPGGIRIVKRAEATLWVPIILFPALIGLIFWAAGRPQEALFTSGLALVVFAAMYPLMRKQMRRRIVKNSLTALRADPNSLYFLPSSVEISPEHFSRETELSYTRISWKGIESVHETPTYLFISLGSAMGVITIPLRCFATPQEASAFAVAARSYLSDTKGAQAIQS